MVRLEEVHALLIDRIDLLARLCRKTLDEVLGEQWDVTSAFAQGGNGDWKDVQAIEEIAAKSAVADRLRQVAVGGRDDPDVGANRLLPPTRSNSRSCSTRSSAT